MKIKTDNLTDHALDWAVAKCEGFTDEVERSGWAWHPSWYNPSTDWQEGGPIIEREKITLEWTGEDWMGYIWYDNEYFAPTPLIAAMRCYVASKLGEEVEIPDELIV
jgi:hypothetical protein